MSYLPPPAVRRAARDALDVREQKPRSQRGMTRVGLARATTLAAGRRVSIQTVMRMYLFLSRTQRRYKEASTWKARGRGWQAYHGWGGDAGLEWAWAVLRAEGIL